MKISFFLAIKGQKIPAPEAFEVPYLHEGNLCSVIVYGSLNKPKILVESFKEKKQLPLTSKCWFFIRISWSIVDGFKFCQYTDPTTRTFLSSNSNQKTPTSLSSTTGKLRGGDTIEISNSNNLVRIVFKAEVNQEDLDTIEPIIFLEKCSEFGIRVVDSKFSNLEAVFDGFSCANCQLVNVEFSDSKLQGVNFSNSYLNQVKFFNSNLNRAKFNNSKLTQVEFSQCNNFKETTFDNCITRYDKQRIENDEILIFNNCNLTDSSFKKAELCSKFEDCNLSKANFLLATLVACKFYDCMFSETIFSHSKFKAFRIQANESIDCYIGVKPDSPSQCEFKISKCKFDGALMNRVEISEQTKVEESHFEGTRLLKSKLRKCEFSNTDFTSTIMKSADLSYADISGSTFKKCCLNEVNLCRVTMIEAKFSEESELVRANFYDANLRGSEFLDSDLTGVDFRYADLTLLNLKTCALNCANFFQTQRGGINLKNCIISCIDWSPNRDGEIQISASDFFNIIEGKTSAAAVIINLLKEGGQNIINNYASASAKSANERLNDFTIQEEIHYNSFTIGNIETSPDEDLEQDEEDTKNNETPSNDSSNKENEQIW